jgi:cytochrome oxidase assembly protein ShyY1
VSRRWIKPSWFAIALTCAGVAAFSFLGFWQLDRASAKELLLAAYAGATDQAPKTLAEARRTTAAGLYPHVRTRGTFDPLHSYVLDDQVRDGRQGMMVYAVFEPDDGSTPLLVNRGFMARTPGGKLPDAPPLPHGEHALSGLYAPPPGSGLRLGGNALKQQTSWPKLTIYIDLAEIGEDLGQPVDSGVLLLDADPASGFVREWTPQILPPERHRGYAFQWFAFAIAAIVIFIVLHWRRVQKES